MARANITGRENDLVDDAGSILWSMVRGEALEFPIDLNFIDQIDNTFNFEAVMIEGNNDGEGSVPTEAHASPAKNTLTVSLPNDRLNWGVGVADYVVRDYVYNTGDGLYYLLNGTATVGLAPNLDTDNWEAFTPNRIWVEFPSTLISDYNTFPQVDKPVYAFFEVSVQEPAGDLFRRLWKPVRGLIEIRYSPTMLVP